MNLKQATTLTAAIAATAPLSAQIVISSPERSLQVDSQEIQSTGFELFDEELFVSFDGSGCQCVTPRGSASQVSVFTAQAFSVASVASSEGGAFSNVSALNRFEFVVTVKAGTVSTLSIDGTVRGSVGPFSFAQLGRASVAIAPVDQPNDELFGIGAEGDDSIDFGPTEVELPAGTYRLTATASADGGFQEFGSASLDFNGSFSTAFFCAGDITRDDVIDLADLQLFLQSFLASDSLADFDANGVYDLADIQAFIDAFNAGCP